MIKTVKCGIAAAVVAAAGVAAFQSYGSYGTQDNSLLMQNVEALAQGPDMVMPVMVMAVVFVILTREETQSSVLFMCT